MAREPSEFMRLYVQAQPALRSYLLSLLGRPDDMEDVYQEVSLVLWEQFEKYDETRPFLHWALGIARNQAARWRRERNRMDSWLRPEVEKQLAQTYLELEEELSGRRQALGACLQRLGERARNLLVLRYGQGLSLQEIGDRERMTLNAVNKALIKIRRFLSECAALLLRAETHQTP